jgi:hypothetical protein
VVLTDGQDTPAEAPEVVEPVAKETKKPRKGKKKSDDAAA